MIVILVFPHILQRKDIQKMLKNQIFLIKKPSQWKKYPPTRKIKKMRFRIAGISAMHLTAS